MSLLIGLHIQESLSANKEVVKRTNDRIYPVVAVQGAPKYPFIIFDSSTNPDEDTKDGAGDEIASVNVCIFAKTYAEAVELAYHVKGELQEKTASYDRFEVVEAGFIKSEEDYNDDLSAYVINLNFEFITSEL